METILGVHEENDGSLRFLVKWVGYELDKSSWENLEDLDCPEKLLQFYDVVNSPKVLHSILNELKKARN